jgi:hypothetical protein
MLVAGGFVVADHGRVLDVDREQVELPRLRVPAERVVATSTTPGSIRRSSASLASRGWARSMSDQCMLPPFGRVRRLGGSLHYPAYHQVLTSWPDG